MHGYWMKAGNSIATNARNLNFTQRVTNLWCTELDSEILVPLVETGETQDKAVK